MISATNFAWKYGVRKYVSWGGVSSWIFMPTFTTCLWIALKICGFIRHGYKNRLQMQNWLWVIARDNVGSVMAWVDVEHHFFYGLSSQDEDTKIECNIYCLDCNIDASSLIIQVSFSSLIFENIIDYCTMYTRLEYNIY